MKIIFRGRSLKIILAGAERRPETRDNSGKASGRFFQYYRKELMRPVPKYALRSLLALLAVGPGIAGRARAQTVVPRPVKMPELLVEPYEILPSDRVPPGNFARSPQDFILCTGPAFVGMTPPPGSVIIRWEGKEYKDIARWNNDLIQETIAAGRDEGRLYAVLDRFEAGLRADPLFYAFNYNAGRVLMLLSLPRRAIKYFEKARALVPDFSGAYINLAQAHARLQEDRAAVDFFKEAARRNPFDPTPVVELGTFYLERDMTFLANDYFVKVLRAYPNHSNAKIGLGRLYMQKNDFVRARELLSTIPTEYLDGRERDDYNRALHFYMALISAELQDYGAAVYHYDRLLAHPEDSFFLDTPIGAIRKRRAVAFELAESQASKLIEE